MQITKLKLQKSKTLGILIPQGKTRFKKLQLQAEAELNDTDDPIISYKQLSDYIDDMLKGEDK